MLVSRGVNIANPRGGEDSGGIPIKSVDANGHVRRSDDIVVRHPFEIPPSCLGNQNVKVSSGTDVCRLTNVTDARVLKTKFPTNAFGRIG